MKDVQNQKDQRNIYLNEVGIRDLKLPVEVKDSAGRWMPVTAVISLSADLKGAKKGTHMSRFVEILQRNNRMDLRQLRTILEEIQAKLDAENSYLSIRFDYFIEKQSPVSGLRSYLAVEVENNASLCGDAFDLELTVRTPVTTLCPCSKEISEASAHNQRATVSITVHTEKFVWIEDLVKIAEQSASSPVYTLLKRPDEKFVTEAAYDRPMFVEDVVREAKQMVDQMPEIGRYAIEAESQESIHNHAAFARVVGDRSEREDAECTH